MQRQQQKQSAASASASAPAEDEPAESQNLVDYFYVVGLDLEMGLEHFNATGEGDSEAELLRTPPLERSYKCKVLHHFPDHTPGNQFDKDSVAMMTMPHGLTLRTDRTIRDAPPVAHHFLITREDGTRVHGVCLIYYEEVSASQVTSAISTLQSIYSQERATGFVDYESRAAMDTVSLHSLNCYSETSDRLFAAKAVGLLTRAPLLHSLEHWLWDLLSAVRWPRPPPLPLESYIYNLLFEVPLPPPGRSVAFRGVYRDLLAHSPGQHELPPFEFSLRHLVDMLQLDNLLQVYTCVLLEYRVVLFSEDYRNLILVAEAITTLLFPFVWPHVYVPILPASLKHFLEAPVPFIMGLRLREDEDPEDVHLPSEANVCFVYIDQRRVKAPDDLPKLPNERELKQEITNILRLYPADCDELADWRSQFQQQLSRLSLSPAAIDAELQPSSGQPVAEAAAVEGGIIVGGGIVKSQSFDADSGMSSTRSSYRHSVQSEANLPACQPAAASAAAASADLNRSDTLEHVYMLARTANMSLENLTERLAAAAATAATTGSNKSDRKPDDVISPVGGQAGDAISSQSNPASIVGTKKSASPDEELFERRYHAMLKFNNAMREIFINHFAFLLQDYDEYVKDGEQDVSDMVSGRDTNKFDKSAFVNDFPNAYLAFLSPFLETQMFATLLDLKILSKLSNQEDSNLRLFHDRIEQRRLQQQRLEGGPHADRLGMKIYQPVVCIPEPDSLVEKRRYTDTQCPAPHLLEGFPPGWQLAERVPGQLGRLNESFLRHRPLCSYPPVLTQSTRASNRAKRVNQRVRAVQHLRILTERREKELAEKHAKMWIKYMQENRAKSLRQPNLSDMAPSVMAQTNWKFVEALLKECKSKTKRMVVEKMGHEALELGHTDIELSGVEENTLVAGLCDLLERIWSHGLSTRHGKSALWSHLNLFYNRELELTKLKRQIPQPQRVQQLNPEASPIRHRVKEALSNMGRDQYSVFKFFNEGSPSGQPDAAVRRDLYSSLKRSRGGGVRSGDLAGVFGQPPVNLLDDIQLVRQLKEVHTDVGKSRAFVRLALEKKLLHAHIKRLLSDSHLLRELYKRFAFLRCEEEREQFLFHLLSLNAVDYFSFSLSLPATNMLYRVFIYSGKKYSGASTSATAWFCLNGQLADTGLLALPKGQMQFQFEHANLGGLTTLRIGHDNTGISPRWFVEFVLVQNAYTGHVYRFQCGRWLGRDVDDGSSERLLVAELLRPSGSVSGGPGCGIGGGVSGTLGRERGQSEEPHGGYGGGGLFDGYRTPPSRCRSPSLSRRSSTATDAGGAAINAGSSASGSAAGGGGVGGSGSNAAAATAESAQQGLSDAVNAVVKFFHGRESPLHQLTLLLCGEAGLVPALETALHLGFRSARFFHMRRLYVWDFIDKAVHHCLGQLVTMETGRKLPATVFCRTAKRIDNSASLGKDSKLQVWLCVGLRDHQLPVWLSILSESPHTGQFYEPGSFMRDPSLRDQLLGLLSSLKEYRIQLDPQLMRGVEI